MPPISGLTRITRADDLRMRPKKPSDTSSVKAVTPPLGADSLSKPAARKGLIRRRPSARGVAAKSATARPAASASERPRPPSHSPRLSQGSPPAAASQAPAAPA